jgi:putative peptidoglycan lipid II flippase
VVVGSLCVLGMIFSPQLVNLLAPGFADVPGKFPLAVKLTRIMFPFLLLVALAAQAMGVLNACNQFGVPALSSTFFNIGSLGFGLALGFLIGPRIGISAIEGMAYGVVIGGAWQLFWQVPSLVRAGFVFRPRVNLSHPGLRNILQLMGPAIVGNASVQVNVMVNTNFASSITDAAGHVINGPVSWLGYAFRFMQLPLGLFGVAIASATLPSISRSAAVGNMSEFRSTLAGSLGMIFFLTIPSSIGLAVLGESMIAAVYQGGRFRAYDTHQTALALSCYAIGLAGYGAIKVLAPAFYALNDARTPMLVSLASILINIAAASSMVKIAGLGHAGLALSTSLVALSSSIVLFELIRRRIGGIQGRRLALSFLKISAASVCMGAACALSSRCMAHWLGISRLARVIDLAISVPFGLIVFYGIAKLFQLPEIESARRALLVPLARRLGLGHVKI